MIIRNEDVREIVSEIPEGHSHIRTTIVFEDGQRMTLQEATVANLVRAYVSIKTHPSRSKTVLRKQRLKERKEGYAEWQLVED